MIFVLLPLALLIAAIAVGFFIWAARTGQFDDLETPALRILFDDEEPRRKAPARVPPAPADTPEQPAKTSQPAITATASTRKVPA